MEADQDANARYFNAMEFSAMGDHAAALAEHAWCIEHARGETDREFLRSMTLPELRILGEQYAPALRALEEWRDAAEERLVSGSGTRDDVRDVDVLHRELGTPERTLVLYDRMQRNGSVPQAVRLAWSSVLVHQLVDARRYADALQLFDAPEQYVLQVMRACELSKSDTSLVDAVRREIGTPCAIFAAFLGAGLRERADEVAACVVTAIPRGIAYRILMQAADRAGAPDAARALGLRGLAALTGDDRALVQAALDRIAPA